MKEKNITKRIALLLCAALCLAVLAGCVSAGAEEIERSIPEETTEAVSAEPAESESSEASEEVEESSEEEARCAWDVKPFDWDAVVEYDPAYVRADLAIGATYHKFTYQVDNGIWHTQPDTLTWVSINIPSEDSYYEEDTIPAKDRAEHLFEYLEANDRRYAYQTYEEINYKVIAPISFNEILKFSEFGGYIFAWTYSPRNEMSPWYSYDGPLPIIYG